MTYPSVDKLQNMLAAEVFDYAADKKKASGRALGTLQQRRADIVKLAGKDWKRIRQP